MPKSKAKPSSSNNGRGRSAITGRFVTPETTRRHPRTTVTEKPKPKKK